MVTVNRATGAVALKAKAPITGTIPRGFHIKTVYDTTNNRVIFPVMLDSCGKIQQLLVYNPADDTWTDNTSQVPANTHGASIAYHQADNAMILGGRVFCEGPPVQTPSPPNLWIYRWAAP
jgi:hypothetical protein